MKNILWILAALFPSLCFGSSTISTDQCSTAQILIKIRPGAVWTMQGDSMDKLKWLDSKQKMPTASEIKRAKSECVEEMKNREALKAQARLDVKDPSVATDKKLQQLILLLDLDK